jgi:hypothetical protein
LCGITKAIGGILGNKDEELDLELGFESVTNVRILPNRIAEGNDGYELKKRHCNMRTIHHTR